jgi:hypothetical protein
MVFWVPSSPEAHNDGSNEAPYSARRRWVGGKLHTPGFKLAPAVSRVYEMELAQCYSALLAVKDPCKNLTGDAAVLSLLQTWEAEEPFYRGHD